MRNRKIFAVGLALIAVLDLAGLIGLSRKVNTFADEWNTPAYTLFVGLNDKDTGRQEIPDDVAVATVRSVLSKYLDGYTLLDARGVWTDDGKQEISENTIVCCVSGADEAAIYGAADELIEALDQHSILITKNLTRSEYYEGRPD